jgi:hypothetical protein
MAFIFSLAEHDTLTRRPVEALDGGRRILLSSKRRNKRADWDGTEPFDGDYGVRYRRL